MTKNPQYIENNIKISIFITHKETLYKKNQKKKKQQL